MYHITTVSLRVERIFEPGTDTLPFGLRQEASLVDEVAAVIGRDSATGFLDDDPPVRHQVR